jgi:hypothetical protein
MPIITLILKVLPKTYHDKKRDGTRIEQFIGDLQQKGSTCVGCHLWLLKHKVLIKFEHSESVISRTRRRSRSDLNQIESPVWYINAARIIATNIFEPNNHFCLPVAY